MVMDKDKSRDTAMDATTDMDMGLGIDMELVMDIFND
jgi:hypothetical protein